MFPRTTAVPYTIISAMALARWAGCTQIVRISSVILRMLEAPAQSLEISHSEWLTPYLALDAAHVGQSYVQYVVPKQPLVRVYGDIFFRFIIHWEL